MYDINTNNIKKGKSTFYILLVIGVIIQLVLGYLTFQPVIKYNRMDYQTESIEVVEESYSVSDETEKSFAFSFMVNGTRYICNSDYSTSENDHMVIYYNSSNPSDCMTENDLYIDGSAGIFMLIGIGITIYSICNLIKLDIRRIKVNKANETGTLKLVKGIPCRFELVRRVKNVPIKMPVVEYKLPSWETITLKGDPTNKNVDKCKTVDLIIDEKNPKVYFIDFEINRNTGNLLSDYYYEEDYNKYEANGEIEEENIRSKTKKIFKDFFSEEELKNDESFTIKIISAIVTIAMGLSIFSISLGIISSPDKLTRIVGIIVPITGIYIILKSVNSIINAIVIKSNKDQSNTIIVDKILDKIFITSIILYFSMILIYIAYAIIKNWSNGGEEFVILLLILIVGTTCLLAFFGRKDLIKKIKEIKKE